MKVNLLLFDGFETLDAFGPVELFGQLDGYELNYYSRTGGNVVSAHNAVVSTDSIADAPKDSILVIPGGRITRSLVNDEAFIHMLEEAANQSHYCLCVCTGSALLAKTGLLDGRKATSNKKAFSWVTSLNSKVQWIRKARWVTDGKYYTSSGVSAGMDMTLGFIRDCFSEEKALTIAGHIEYRWNSDNTEDDFAGEE
jgi:putative intracellular protease/amidase